MNRRGEIDGAVKRVYIWLLLLQLKGDGDRRDAVLGGLKCGTDRARDGDTRTDIRAVVYPRDGQRYWTVEQFQDPMIYGDCRSCIDGITLPTSSLIVNRSSENPTILAVFCRSTSGAAGLLMQGSNDQHLSQGRQRSNCCSKSGRFNAIIIGDMKERLL